MRLSILHLHAKPAWPYFHALDDRWDGTLLGCKSALREWFPALPVEVEKIDLVLYDTPTPDRIELKYITGRLTADGTPQKAFEAFHYWIRGHLLTRGVVYLEVWY